MIPFSSQYSLSQPLAVSAKSLDKEARIEQDSTVCCDRDKIPLGKRQFFYPCNSSSIEDTLQLELSSKGLFLTLPYSSTPHVPISLKDRNLKLLSPQAAAQKVADLGLSNLAFVLKKNNGNPEVYLLPRLQGGMERELLPPPSQGTALFVQKQGGIADWSGESPPPYSYEKIPESRLLFYKERASSLRPGVEYDADNVLSIIKAKLANFLEEPLHVGAREFKRAVESLETLSEEQCPDIPWSFFLDGCALFQELCLEKKEPEELYLYVEKLTDFFVQKRVFLDQDLSQHTEDKPSRLLEGKFLELLQQIRAFFQLGGDYLQEQRYLTLSLRLATSPFKQRELLLEGGSCALAFAERKRKEETSSQNRGREEEEYKKTESFQGYEEACAYFAAAYRLTTKCPELSNQERSSFEHLIAVQGRYLSLYMAQEKDEKGCEDYAYGFKIRASSFALSSLSLEQKQELAKEIENVADYLEACGYSKLAYYTYDVLYEQFKEVEGVNANRYRALATHLGSKSEATKARERFLGKIQQFGREIESIRNDSSALLSPGGVSLEKQKEINARYRHLIRELFTTCSLLIDPKGHYPYALAVVGSLARDEMCPFSDFELALLLEKEEHRSHFIKVAEVFHLLVISLGETKVALIGKEGLLPRGFSLDKYNNPLRLCATPDSFAYRQTTKGEDLVQLNVLRTSSFLTGKKELFTQYSDQLRQALNLSIEDASADTWRKKHALGAVSRACKYVDPAILCHSSQVDIKEDLLRFCVFAFEGLSLYYGLDTDCHTSEKVAFLCAKGLFPDLLKDPIQEYLAFTFGLRWKSHLHAQEEQDRYTLEPREKETVVTAYHTLLKPLKETLLNWLGEKEALQDPTFFAIAHFQEAKKALEKRAFACALTFLEKAVSLKEDPFYLKLYGQLSFCLGHFTQANKAWQKNRVFIQQEIVSLQQAKPKFMFGTWQEFPFVDRKKASSEKMMTPLEECAQEEKLFSTLIDLAQEQEDVQQALKEAFQTLGIKELLPFSEEEDFLVNAMFQDLTAHNFAGIWDKSMTIWLAALLQGELSPESLLSCFGATYTKLPKAYRKEVRKHILSSFPHKLPLLQDFYCEEGYVFSAEARRSLWLNTLNRAVGKDPSSSCVAGLYLPKGYLSKEIERELFKGENVFKKTVSWGNRLVNQAQGSFFKKDPESPGDEYAIFLLNHLLTGQGSPPVEILSVVNKQSHLLLASEKVEGEPLHLFLAKHPEALSKIDKKQFSQMFLMALLTDPEDGKADNYIAHYTQDAQGGITNVQIIGVDNDHVFVKPFVQKGVVFQNSQLFIKTVLFCFEEMQEPLHVEVAESFLKLDVTTILREWLEALAEYNKRVETLLDKDSLNRYWQEKILIPFFMHPDQVLYLHEKMARLQRALKQSKKTYTHWELLNLIHPKVAGTYAAVYRQDASPLRRFELLTKDAYRRVRGQSFTLTTTSQIKQYTFKDSLSSIEDFQKKRFIPEESLKILARLADHKRLKEIADKPIGAIQEELKRLLTTPFQEDLLERQEWSKIRSQDLDAVLSKFEKVPLRRVHLSDCKALTDEQLIRFIQGCRHPITEEIEVERLNLQGCTGLTDRSMEAIRLCTRLNRLNLEGTHLEKIELDKTLSSLALVNLESCQKLTSLKIEGPVKKLFIQGCTSLHKLSLHCPKLSKLFLQKVPYTLNCRMSKDTPLPQDLFLLLRKARHEVQLNVEASIDETVMEEFQRAFQENTALKVLSLNIVHNSDLPITLPRKMDFQGQPSIEDLSLNLASLEELKLEGMSALKILRIGNEIAATGMSTFMKALSGIKYEIELDLKDCVALPAGYAEQLLSWLQVKRLTLSSSLLNYQNDLGQTFLHLAVMIGNKKLVPHLAFQGASLTTKDIFGNTPLQLAMSRNDEEMGLLLERAKEEKIERIAFGRKDWEKYFGYIGYEPPLPQKILEVLESPCPIWPDKKIEETHLLTLIPQSINGKTLTVEYLGELIQNPQGGGNAAKCNYAASVKYSAAVQPIGHSHWVLMSKDILPNTRVMGYEEQCRELERLKARSADFRTWGYRVPMALEAAVSILMEYVKHGNRLYSNTPIDGTEKLTYTRCADTGAFGWRALVGGFDTSTLAIVIVGTFLGSDGIGLVREVSGEEVL